jgi:hypothetical protein
MQKCDLRKGRRKLINKCNKVGKVIRLDECGIYRREEKYIHNLVGRYKEKEKNPLERHRRRWNLT